jgi:hypothetical protein
MHLSANGAQAPAVACIAIDYQGREDLVLNGCHSVGDRIDRVAVCGRLFLHIGKPRKDGRQRCGLRHKCFTVQQLEVDIRSHDDHVVAQALAGAVPRDLT